MRNVILLFLLIVGWTTTVYAQNEQETIEVTGIVTDPKNEPLIGVNVTARNMPGFGAITDINGRYKIKVPNYSYLIFSYVGFTKQEIFIKDKKIINIVMAETKETVIDEVVVTGTGAQKKVTVTGAVTTVDVSQLRTPTASITNALAGNVAGILAAQIFRNTGVINGVVVYNRFRPAVFRINSLNCHSLSCKYIQFLTRQGGAIAQPLA